MSVILSQVIRREALFVSGSCLVCHQRFRLKWLAARLELLNLSAHRRFLNGVSVCGGACFSVPVQSRKPRTGRTHSFWPLWLTELLPCSHFWNGPQGPMQQSPAWMQGASRRQKCPLGSLLGMCVDGAHFHLASHSFHWKCRGFLFCGDSLSGYWQLVFSSKLCGCWIYLHFKSFFLFNSKVEDAFYKGELRLNGEKLWKKSRTVSHTARNDSHMVLSVALLVSVPPWALVPSLRSSVLVTLVGIVYGPLSLLSLRDLMSQKNWNKLMLAPWNHGGRLQRKIWLRRCCPSGWTFCSLQQFLLELCSLKGSWQNDVL